MNAGMRVKKISMWKRASSMWYANGVVSVFALHNSSFGLILGTTKATRYDGKGYLSKNRNTCIEWKNSPSWLWVILYALCSGVWEPVALTTIVCQPVFICRVDRTSCQHLAVKHGETAVSSRCHQGAERWQPGHYYEGGKEKRGGTKRCQSAAPRWNVIRSSLYWIPHKWEPCKQRNAGAGGFLLPSLLTGSSPFNHHEWCCWWWKESPLPVATSSL